MINLTSKGVILGSRSVLDGKLRGVATGLGTVSAIYKLLSLSLPDSTIPTKLQWGQDIGSPFTADQSDSMLKHSTSMSNCVRYKIIQMKVIHRT